MQPVIWVGIGFTFVAVLLMLMGIAIFKNRKASTTLHWNKLKKKDKVTSAYIGSLIVVLLIAWITTYFLIFG